MMVVEPVTRNKARQPKYCVIRPPMEGPQDAPTNMDATESPKTLPRLSAGKASTRMGTFVANIIAALRPCKTRFKINIDIFGAITHKKEAVINKRMPSFSIVFLPYISAIRPIGIANSAELRRKDSEIKVSEVAEAENSLPICGIAMLMENEAKLVVKFVISATSKVAF